MRSISHLIHKNAKFYAQNVSILPLYNKVYVDNRPKLRPEGFDGDTCSFDPDLPIYHSNWIEYNAQALRKTFQLDNFIRMNGGVCNWTPESYMKCDPFLREAFMLAYNAYAKEENQKQQRLQSDLDQKLEASKEYKSPFSGVTKPTFIN